MKVVGVAIWGLGRHALKRIIPAIAAIDNLSLVGVCSRNKELVEDCASKWDCIGWTNHVEMLENPQVDVVYIATPIGIHAQQTVQALESGKHVWCEKPLTCNYKDTKSLISLAKKNNLMLVETFMYLYHPQFRKVQNYINDKDNGQIHSVICRFGIPELDKPGFRYNADLCGGALWDIASYNVSAVVALFSGQNVKVLFSEVLSKENSIVDTEGRALLRFSQGTLAYLEWGMEVGYRNEIDLWSEKGSFFTDKIFSKPENYQPIYRLRDKNGNEYIENGEISEQFIEMFYNFYDVYFSSELIKEEYRRILNRAKVLDEIVKRAELSE